MARKNCGRMEPLSDSCTRLRRKCGIAAQARARETTVALRRILQASTSKQLSHQIVLKPPAAVLQHNEHPSHRVRAGNLLRLRAPPVTMEEL
mmetsp:Transcript_823/g.1581  ORF Transcript_823/g.1581 Transcript_823/m.1581 type:complete len:92 (+) Transcript_823:451-726(+)